MLGIESFGKQTKRWKINKSYSFLDVFPIKNGDVLLQWLLEASYLNKSKHD